MHLRVARRFPSSLPQIVCRRVNGMSERHRRLGLELLSARVGGTTKLARTQRRKAPVSLTADELEPKIRWRRPDLFGAGQKPIGSGTHLDSFVDLISPAVEALPAGHSTNNAIAANASYKARQIQSRSSTIATLTAAGDVGIVSGVYGWPVAA